MTTTHARPDPSGPMAALLITDDPALHQQVTDLAAHLHITITTVTRPPRNRALWNAAPLVLLGVDLLDRCHAAGLPPRPGVIVVTDHLSTDSDALRHAGDPIGARHLAVLPGAWTWLADQLTHPPPHQPREHAAAPDNGHPRTPPPSTASPVSGPTSVGGTVPVPPHQETPQ